MKVPRGRGRASGSYIKELPAVDFEVVISALLVLGRRQASCVLGAFVKGGQCLTAKKSGCEITRPC